MWKAVFKLCCVNVGVSSVAKRCRSNLYLGTDLSHRDFVFTEAPCGHSTMRNTHWRQEKKKEKKKKQLYEVTDRMCWSCWCETSNSPQCYHRKTGLNVSDWHWIGGHGGLKLSLLSGLKGKLRCTACNFGHFLCLQLTFIKDLTGTFWFSRNVYQQLKRYTATNIIWHCLPDYTHKYCVPL